ncbi:MAG: sulfonate transport system permease protein [Solirubrobacteraceae bacterium]|nr:sulfonate transport system permease protein [Solirubrobacteraceae bacterium]
MSVWGLRILFLAVVLGVWQALSGAVVDPYFISSPSRIASDLYDGFVNGTLARDVGMTTLEAGIGLALGMVTGIVFGLVFGFFPLLDRVLEPFIGAVNAIPRPALAPLFVLWFGLGMTSKVFVAWSLVFFVAFYNAYQGVKSIDQDVVNAVRVMRASRMQMLRIVILPAVFTWVFAAFKLSVGYALIGAIVGEFVGSTAGLGYQLTQAQGLLDTDRVFSIVVVTGVLAGVVLYLAQLVENKVLKWRPQVQFG